MLNFPATIDVPLRHTDDGTIRIGETRILLEIVIRAFQNGESPEVIVEHYPSLKLEDVYAVMAYYLRYTADVHAYLDQVADDAKAIRAKIEAKQDIRSLRARLLKRKQSS